jgi:zinc D-Ala-D-Ala carboxypeptidase
MELKHFKLSEFDSPDLPGSGKNMKPEFLKKLDNARSIANIPFGINSGFRTIAHNAKVKGVDSSSHTQGWAADIACKDGANRFTIVNALLKAGINRIGISGSFIHADCDPTKPKNVIWLY